MPTSNIPLTYAVKSGSMVHLYLLVYSGTTRPDFNPGEPMGKVISFNIVTTGSGQNPHFHLYSFEAGIYTDMKVHCNNHIRTILLADLDIITTPLPPGVQAKDAPYAYTQKNDKDHFTVELVLFASASAKFSCAHTRPDAGKTDTLSAIETKGANQTTMFTDTHIFQVDDFYTTGGTHEVTTPGNPKKKSKTKNINHSPTPFPRRKIPKKS